MTDAAGDDTLDVELFPYLGSEWESETRWRSGMDVGNDSLSIC